MRFSYLKPKTNLQNTWLNGRTAKTPPLTKRAKATPTTMITTTTTTMTTPTTTTTTTATKLKRTTKAIIAFIAAYFEDSNIHGLRYVVKGGLTAIEKCLWLTFVIVSMYCCVEIGFQSVDRYYTKSTVVGLERNFYYWNTTMPSITICPLIRLDVKLFDAYCRQHNLSPEDQALFYRFLEKLANSTYSNFNDIPDNKAIDLILDRLNIKPNKYMELISNITGDRTIKYKTDLANIANAIRSTSEDYVIETRQILTEYGFCYMTNTMLDEKFSSMYLLWGKYPVNEIRGLPTTLRVKQSSYFDTDVSYYFLGFDDVPIDIFLHSSYEIMQLDHNLGYTNEPLRLETESIEIVAEKNFESGASVEQRKCRFQHESNLTHFPIYTRNICQQECRLNLAYEICKCIPHFYPNRIKTPKTVCDYKTLRDCLMQHEHFFLKLYKVDKEGNKQMAPCYCVQNCRDAIVNGRSKFVLIELSEIQLQNANVLVGGNSLLLSIIDPPKYRLKRQIIFSFTDLLVSIGGNAGLFLGFSVLCLTEVIYYFTLRLYFYLMKACLKKNTSTSAIVKLQLDSKE